MSVWNFTIYKSSRQAFFISWILEERSQDDWAKQTIRRKRRKNHRNWDWASSSVQRAPVSGKDDKEMFLLQESIEKYGILNPLIVRPVPDGYYEIISGHRRKHAAEKLGYRKVPVIIRVLSEDDSILSMVDSNLHRERISYSEKAFAYKLKNDVLKRKSGRKRAKLTTKHQESGQ